MAIHRSARRMELQSFICAIPEPPIVLNHFIAEAFYEDCGHSNLTHQCNQRARCTAAGRMPPSIPANAQMRQMKARMPQMAYQRRFQENCPGRDGRRHGLARHRGGSTQWRPLPLRAHYNTDHVIGNGTSVRMYEARLQWRCRCGTGHRGTRV